MEQTNEESPWAAAPDIFLLQIFYYLTPKELMTVAFVSKSWSRVCYDNTLWKKIFYRFIKVEPDVPICPGEY